MLTHSEILHRLTLPEHPLVERKSKGVKPHEIRQSACAFANFLAPEEEAIIFIGVRNDGQIQGLSDSEADSRQMDVREACERECYPSIKFRIVLLHQQQNVLAVVIPASDNRPHFSGPAYVRRGSESVAASAEIFQQLIDSRNSKVSELLRYKDASQVVTVVAVGHRLIQDHPVAAALHREIGEFKVTGCNAHYVQLARLHDSYRISRALERVQISRDEEKWRPMLTLSAS